MTAPSDKSLEELCELFNDLPVSVGHFAELVAKVEQNGPRSEAAYAMALAASEIAELGMVAAAIADKMLAGETGDCRLNTQFRPGDGGARGVLDDGSTQ